MPTLRKGDKFLVDLVKADEVEMVREGCRAAEVWRVSVKLEVELGEFLNVGESIFV